uniref:Uncharacterized protein n=1 Tax=Rhipicephalus zambeziensis TaxID=60191 RepID=A0A224YHP9_9ACAR
MIFIFFSCGEPAFLFYFLCCPLLSFFFLYHPSPFLVAVFFLPCLCLRHRSAGSLSYMCCLCITTPFCRATISWVLTVIPSPLFFFFFFREQRNYKIKEKEHVTGVLIS